MRPHSTTLPALLLTAGLLAPLQGGAADLPSPDLLQAIQTGDRALAQELLADGADPEQRDAFDRTPLYLASRAGDSELVRALLARGADIDARNLGGLTPLHAAAAHGHAEVARMLLVNCADTTTRDLYRRTPLHLAAAHGHTGVAEMLIEGGADVEARLRSGRTAFGTAIAYRNPETVVYLRGALPPLPEPEDELADGEADAGTSPAGEENAEDLAPVATAPPGRERPRGTEGTTRFVHEKLRQLGYDPGPGGGRRTAQLLDAVRAYQDSVGVVRESERGTITRCLVDRLGIEVRLRERQADGS